MAGNSLQPGRSVTSKVTDILKCFVSGGEYTLSELARLGGLPVSTTHRLVNELIDAGVLDRADTGSYRVGQLMQMLRRPVGSASVLDRVPGAMQDVAAALARPVMFGVLRDGAVSCFRSTVDGPASMTGRGLRLPLHATALGKALLAFSAAAVVRSVIAQGLRPFTPQTKTDPVELRHALSVIRLTRVATAEHELRPGCCEVAVPVFEPGGTVVGALGAAVAAGEPARQTVVPLLTVAARGLTRELACAGLPEAAVVVA